MNYKKLAFGCIKDNCTCYTLINGYKQFVNSPKKETKEETLEEAAEKCRQFYLQNNMTINQIFEAGSKWQKAKMYNNQDLKNCWDASSAYTMASHKDFKQTHPNFIQWIKELKKNK